MSGLAVLCPGQGTQHPAMFDRVEGEPATEEVLLQAAESLNEHPRTLARNNSRESLFENRLAQPLICAAELATWAALRRKLPEPAVFAGYSVGELAAYGCVGALTAKETIRLAQVRAQLMDDANTQPSGMVAVVGMNRNQIEALCAEFGAEIAIVNSRNHFVIGVPLSGQNTLEQAAQARGGQTVRRLNVTLASHTSWLSAATKGFMAALQKSALAKPEVPVLESVSGAPVRDRERAINALAIQLSTRLDWAACMESALEMRCRVFLELGPGSSLSRMMREAYPEVAARSVEEFQSLEAVVDWVSNRIEE